MVHTVYAGTREEAESLYERMKAGLEVLLEVQGHEEYQKRLERFVNAF